MKSFKPIVLTILLGAVLSFSCNTNVEPENPEKEITKVRNVFNQGSEKPDHEYDLEETIRIIHGLDNARKEANSFEEYLEFMAKQDYSNVAPDVLEAKTRLLPILDRLMKAEKKLEETAALYKTFTSISEVVVDDAVVMGISAAATGGFSPEMATGMVKMGKESFSAIQEQKKLEDEIKFEIEDIKDEYLTYLDNYVPVYVKYMDEWDRLCLKRDNAYLEIHQGNIDAALVSLDDVLKIDSENKEALILKAFSLLVKEQNSRLQKNDQKIPALKNDGSLAIAGIQNPSSDILDSIINKNENEAKPVGYAEEAKEILEHYIDQNPDRSAPALLLLGSYHAINDDNEQAVSFYNQSAVEYPRQSTVLLDMLNSYKQRTYLRKSAEGGYILELYKSTMEGFGFFSPNFQKALIEANQYEFENAKDEILKHFFRRGNQGVYDYLISDMIHCETYLPESFNLIFREKSFLDLEASTKMWSSDKLNIKINNRSDVKLSNVRVFLCLHFTDMYKDDYEVFKVKTTVSNIEPHSVADFGDVEIDFELYGKKKDVDKDIVSARAIIVTDDIVSWVDEEDFKITNLKAQENFYQNIEGSRERYSKYESELGLDWENLSQVIEKESSFEANKSYIGKDNIIVKLPRSLVEFNPLFSINQLSVKEKVLPSAFRLNGPSIELEFDHNIPAGEDIELFLNSKKINIKWVISFDEEKKINTVSTFLI